MFQSSSNFTCISQNVSRTQLCTEVYGALCPQINNSKLCTLRQFSKGKLKAVKKLPIDSKLFVHEMYLVCVHKIYLFMIYP
jgi:hypothetical protein